MLRRTSCRLGGGVHRVWVEEKAKPELLETSRLSEKHMIGQTRVFDKYRKEMADRRDKGNPENELRGRTFAFQPDDLNFRAQEKIQKTKPLLPRVYGAARVEDEKGFPWPFAMFLPFFFTFYYTFIAANSGSISNYKIPDPDKVHPYIRFNSLPAFKYGKEPLCNPDNNGGLCELRQLPEVSGIRYKPHGTPAH